MSDGETNLEINTERIIRNKDFIEQFNKMYPGWDLKSVDKELLVDIILTMFEENLITLPKTLSNNQIKSKNIMDKIENKSKNEDQNKKDNIVNNLDENIVIDVELFGCTIDTEKINKIMLNRMIADSKIPELLVPDNVIIIKGFINGININVFVDTCASGCCMSINSVKKCGLEDIIDNKNIISVKGITNKKLTLGKIWYLDLELFDSNDKNKSFPTCCEIIDDVGEQIDLILGSNFLRKYNCSINFSQRFIILEDNDKKECFINFK